MKRFILNFVVFVDNTRRKTVIYLPNWGRALTWGRRVPEAAEKSHDVGRRYRCNICVSH